MFLPRPIPVMRGDLFALLDPDSGRTERKVTPDGIARQAQRLVERVRLGERSPGSPVVMQCLEELAALGGGEPIRAYSTLSIIRQRLRTLGLSQSRGLPGTLRGERVLVVPQTHKATVLRVLSAQEHRTWFVVTRESVSGAGLPEPLEEQPRPELADSAMGQPRYDRPEVTFRLYRFGEVSSDIRLCMRVLQEPGAYTDIRVAGDGTRVAVLSGDVIEVFDGDGRPVLSKLPLRTGEDTRLGTEVTGLAIDGDVLALGLAGRVAAGAHVEAGPRPAELALVSIEHRRGVRVGAIGEEVDGLILGEREAYVLDGVMVVRVPLSPGGEASHARLAQFSFRPWFAEYPWSPRHLMSWDGERFWLSNGHKLVVLDALLDSVLAEIVLPEPIIDFTVTGNEVRLVHHDANACRLRVAHWVLE